MTCIDPCILTSSCGSGLELFKPLAVKAVERTIITQRSL